MPSLVARSSMIHSFIYKSDAFVKNFSFFDFTHFELIMANPLILEIFGSKRFVV